jgi:glycosyltransferase involved in cell wall biosynthesis
MSNTLAIDDGVRYGDGGRPGSRLRVLQMIGFLSDAGGAERFCLGLATHLPPDRFETWVCAPRGGDPRAIRSLEDAGVRFIDLGRRRKVDVHRFTGLTTLLRRERFDVLHSHMFGSNLWGALLGRACQVPVVLAHEQTWSYEGDRTRAWLDGHVIGRLATRFIAVSAADARRMVAIEGVPRAKVLVIPNAYVPSPVSAPGDLRAELGLSQSTPLVGTAVVMRAQKALEVLVDAHARVVETVPEAHLVLAGDGPRRPALERRIRELGLESRTHFLGLRDDVDSIIQSLDVAAMSSDFEGTPLFAFECMANGTPLVATAVGGLPDVIQNGRNGLLVAPRQPRELASGITSLLLDPELRSKIATAAGADVEQYTIQKISGRFADLYERLAATSTGES